MQIMLLQLEQRIQTLEALADEVATLARQQTGNVNPEFSKKSQQWYRGARELLVQQRFSGLSELEAFYTRLFKDTAAMGTMIVYDYDCRDDFARLFPPARSLVHSLIEEVKSRELPVLSQLSFAISASELETAGELLAQSNGIEAMMRASGVVARVALERHLFTVADARSIPVVLNPPHKKKAEAQDLLNTLAKGAVITPVQKSELELLFRIGNFCAHPKETVQLSDVKRLIERGRELCSIII